MRIDKTKVTPVKPQDVRSLKVRRVLKGQDLKMTALDWTTDSNLFVVDAGGVGLPLRCQNHKFVELDSIASSVYDDLRGTSFGPVPCHRRHGLHLYNTRPGSSL